ncbi:Y-family DNA polymerase [Vibrio sp. RC27]
MQLWLYLDFPYLQLDTLFSTQQEDTQTSNDEPLAIVDGKNFSIVQANQAALDQGIQIGMGMGSASAMCAHLQVHPYQPEIEQTQLSEIAQWLYLVTSDIVLFPPQGILLRVSNMLTLYQGLEHYWQCIEQHMQPWKLRYQFSCGFSPLSAMLLAKSGMNLLSENRSKFMEKLNHFPITATELDHKQVDALRRVGVTKLSELFALPMADLARRFDINLVNYVGRLLGQFKHPLNFHYPPEKFSTDLELLYDIDNCQWLLKPLAILLKRLEQFLLLRNQVVYELELCLIQRANHQQTPPQKQVTFTSATGEYRADRWLTLAQLSLESLTLTQAVHHLQLNVIRSGEQPAHADDLFSGTQGALQPLELISLLQAKLGKQAVSKVIMSNDPRPEKSSYFLDATQTITTSERSAQLRPSLLHSTPERLTKKVELIHGPERIVTGWWDGQPITRDYYIAYSNTGCWLWVFRDVQKHWYLHGQFS